MKFKVYLSSLLAAAAVLQADALEPLRYNHPGLTVDLAVGLWAWPLPMDFDGDGDLDLVVACPDKPYNGVYVFENASGSTRETKMPIFKPARRISGAVQNMQVSYVDGKPRVLAPGVEFRDFQSVGIDHPEKLPVPANVHANKVRGNFWRYVDFDGDGAVDLLVGADDWTDYGWDNGYDATGTWKRGPLRGFVYFVRNEGTTTEPRYGKPVRLDAGDKPLETFGWPSPNCADFDGDGDLDLLCGEFRDGFTYFENIGTRQAPRYAPGRSLVGANGVRLAMDLEMITPTAIDWDGDGDLDIISGDEDGRVALLENTGRMGADHAPVFLPPRYFQQEADLVKFGALATPVGYDWDGDGDTDIIAGNTAGYLGFIENLSGPKVAKPRWAAPRLLEDPSGVIRFMAGANGSIQGPAEAKWGYTTCSIADWDGDGLPDLLVNSILGKVVWFENIGTRHQPKFAAAQPIEVAWDGAQPQLAWGWMRPSGAALLTQWRTTPLALDWNGDGLTDLIMLDQAGYLAYFARASRDGRLILQSPRRILLGDSLDRGEPAPRYVQTSAGEPLWMNKKPAGGSGRRKLCAVDWDGDGRMDLLINAANAAFLQQTKAEDGRWYFKDRGLLSPVNIEGHDVSPAVVDFDGNGIPDFLGGAEDGHFYLLENSRSK